MTSERTAEIEGELKDILADLVDKHFPKHECRERGQAMVLVAQALVAFLALLEREKTRARLDELYNLSREPDHVLSKEFGVVIDPAPGHIRQCINKRLAELHSQLQALGER